MGYEIVVLWRDGEETILNIDEPVSYVVTLPGLWITARTHKKYSMIF